MAVVGKYILENLTTGMYQDSKIMYREYIQNACDQIDKAVTLKILKSVNEGLVDIFIDSSKRYVSIEDNATGVKADEFVSTLGDIANSDKTLGVDKGFRGIGRLCGLAYCKTLRFSSSYMGEEIQSIMTCDAATLRKMIYEKTKYSINDILEKTIHFSTKKESADSHYFRVELEDVNESNHDLLNTKTITDYLSFVAPAQYQNKFYLRQKIYEFARVNSFKIDEYVIKINGNPIYKNYTCKLKEKSTNGELKNYDEISDVQFKILNNKDGVPLAWFWYGICRFDIQIPECNPMRGFRIRTGNIQIGDDNALQKLFKEARGNYYFIGELFTISPDLIPNSQRDYFNENTTRVELEDAFKDYAFDNLYKIYYQANALKNAYKKQAEYSKKASEYQEKENTGKFIDEAEREEALAEVEKAKENADKASKTIEKAKAKESDPTLKGIREKIETKYGNNSPEQETTPIVQQKPNPGSFRTQQLSKLDKRERKIVSRIFSIINNNLEKEQAQKIIQLIEDDLK